MKTTFFNKMISRTFPVYISLLFSSVFVFLSCSKSSEQGDLVGASNQRLQLRVVGIDEPLELMANSPISNNLVNEVDLQYIKSSDVTYSTSFSPTAAAQHVVKNNLKGSLQRMGKSASTTSALGITYRFVLFLKKGNTYEYAGHKDITSTSTYESANLEVAVGATYKWVAYSYNNDAPIIDIINATDLSIPTRIDKDLLYASNELSIPNSTENLQVDILFKHRLARLAITFKADEYPAVIPDYLANQAGAKFAVKLANTSVNYFKKGDFNILDNVISNVLPVAYTGNLPVVPLINSSGDPIRVAYLYTADLISKLNDLELSVENLQLVVDDINTFRDGDFPIVTNENFVIKALSNVVPASGFSYSPTVNFKSLGDGIVRKGCVLWGNGFLSYVPNESNEGTGTYSITHSTVPNTLSSVNDYWLFNSLTPWDPIIAKEPKTPKDHPHEAGNKWIIDPCRELELDPTVKNSNYSWRMPTFKEVIALNNVEKTYTGWNRGIEVSFNPGKDSVNIPPNSYFSYKVDGGRWITFFKTGAINVQDYDNRTNFAKWTLNTPDSFFIPVYNADGNVSSYRVLHMDGEDTAFETDTKDKKVKTPVRCVKTYNVPECANYAANPDYTQK